MISSENVISSFMFGKGLTANAVEVEGVYLILCAVLCAVDVLFYVQ
jgi:hypothetical protein